MQLRVSQQQTVANRTFLLEAPVACVDGASDQARHAAVLDMQLVLAMLPVA